MHLSYLFTIRQNNVDNQVEERDLTTGCDGPWGGSDSAKA